MNKEKKIEEFIKNSIKDKVEIIDDTKLMSLLNEMTTEEIRTFWLRFSAHKILTPAIARIPHWWKKKEQEKAIKHLQSVYCFYPKEKDQDGKYIINRTELIDHVKPYLVNIVKEQIQFNLKFEKRPSLRRIQSFLLFVFVAMIPTYIICNVLSTNHYFKSIVVGYIAIIQLFVAILMGIIQTNIARKEKIEEPLNN